MKEYGLLIDTTNQYLIFILLIDNIPQSQVMIPAARKVTELFRPILQDLLTQHQIKLSEITTYFVITGPGSYTGVRIGMGFVKVIAAIDPRIKVYQLNSLLWQTAGVSAISMLDARGDHSYFAVFENKKPVIPVQVIDNQTCSMIASQFAQFKIIKDYEHFSPVDSFNNLRTQFMRVLQISQWEPVYIKKAV